MHGGSLFFVISNYNIDVIFVFRFIFQMPIYMSSFLSLLWHFLYCFVLYTILLLSGIKEDPEPHRLALVAALILQLRSTWPLRHQSIAPLLTCRGMCRRYRPMSWTRAHCNDHHHMKRPRQVCLNYSYQVVVRHHLEHIPQRLHQGTTTRRPREDRETRDMMVKKKERETKDMLVKKKDRETKDMLVMKRDRETKDMWMKDITICLICLTITVGWAPRFLTKSSAHPTLLCVNGHQMGDFLGQAPELHARGRHVYTFP